MTFNQKLVGSEHILATDENDAVHAIKVFTISPKILDLSKSIFVNYLNSKCESCEKKIHPEEVWKSCTGFEKHVEGPRTF